jgi:hypothetical protein
MEGTLLHVAGTTQTLCDIFDAVTVTVGYPIDPAQHTASEADALVKIRALAFEIFHILQPGAYVAKSLPQQVTELLVRPIPMDVRSRWMSMWRRRRSLAGRWPCCALSSA